jgi:hypothetical protein
MSGIQAVRAQYAGTWFASTLEADWAATFDSLDWYWQYEPVAVKLPDGQSYRPDFYLPSQRVWCEVKGPHNERIAKPELLQQALGYDEWAWATELVVVLRPPGPGETTQWHGTRDDQDIVIVRCPECEHYGFMDYSGIWSCRRHLSAKSTGKFWRGEGGDFRFPGDLPMIRAPRPKGRAA